MSSYDYIIAGAGASGLTLAYLISQNRRLREKKVLILDKKDKRTNDRTWCFWEKDENIFEELVYKSWDHAYFFGKDYQQKFDIRPYSYKMIRGIDFYEFMEKRLGRNSQFTWINEKVKKIGSDGSVETAKNTYHADYVFNSTYGLKDFDIPPEYHQLLQHFKGWVIQTEEEAFDPSSFTYMDFRVPQQGDFRFGYVLPFSKTSALVEYTLFTPSLLDETEYQEGLKDYLENTLKVKHYHIEETEFGVIPMTDFPFQQSTGKKIIHIGTSGGFTKPSTGYTFLRSQKMIKTMVENLAKERSPLHRLPYKQKRFRHYDKTLLEVLVSGKLSGEEVFTRLFERNGAHALFKFLDEETGIFEELKIMNSTKKSVFMKAFFKRLKY